jgi:hypothetical protein
VVGARSTLAASPAAGDADGTDDDDADGTDDGTPLGAAAWTAATAPAFGACAGVGADSESSPSAPPSIGRSSSGWRDADGAARG